MRVTFYQPTTPPVALVGSAIATEDVDLGDGYSGDRYECHDMLSGCALC